MASPASFKRHPIHPMLVPLPIGLWIFSLVCDAIYLFGAHAPVWKDVAFYTMAGGVAGALLAAVPGLIDLLSLSPSRAKTLGVWHMALNLAAVGAFGVNLWVRSRATPESNPPLLLSIVGVILIGISGWLGGEMVYVHGVAVEPQPPPRGR
jgi:uncharacterized membrane protein